MLTFPALIPSLPSEPLFFFNNKPLCVQCLTTPVLPVWLAAVWLAFLDLYSFVYLYLLEFLVVYISKYNLIITIYLIWSNIAYHINLTSLAWSLKYAPICIHLQNRNLNICIKPGSYSCFILFLAISLSLNKKILSIARKKQNVLICF